LVQRTNHHVLEEILFRNNYRFENWIAWIHSTNRERNGEKCFPSRQAVIRRRALPNLSFTCDFTRAKNSWEGVHSRGLQEPQMIRWNISDTTRVNISLLRSKLHRVHNLGNEIQRIRHHYHFNATVCRRNSLTTGQLSDVAH